MAKNSSICEIWTVTDFRFICKTEKFYEKDILSAMACANAGRWVDIFLGEENIGHLITKTKVKSIKELVDSIVDGGDFPVFSFCFCEEDCNIYIVLPEESLELVDGVFCEFANKMFFRPNITFDTPVPKKYSDFYNSIIFR